MPAHRLDGGPTTHFTTRPTPRRTGRRRGARWLAGAALLAHLAGCGGGSEVLLVPFFTFGFAFNGTLADDVHDVFLNIDPNVPTSATGPLADTSTLRIDTDARTITGSYSGCTLSFTVGPHTQGTTSALLAAAYSGRFTGPNTIELTPTSGTQPVLTLTRGGSDPRPQTC